MRCYLPCILKRKFLSLLDSNQILQGVSLWPGLFYAVPSIDLSPFTVFVLEPLQRLSCIHQWKCCISCEEGLFPFINNLTAVKSESQSYSHSDKWCQERHFPLAFELWTNELWPSADHFEHIMWIYSYENTVLGEMRNQYVFRARCLFLFISSFFFQQECGFMGIRKSEKYRHY